MSNAVVKGIYLHEELLTTCRLIEIGFGEYQNLEYQNLGLANDFYHLPFQLISSGFERLMKCHICLGHHEELGSYPTWSSLKSYGHDLLDLKSEILNSYFSSHNIPALEKDREFLSDDKELEKLLGLLSDFGKNARYHNFDMITSAPINKRSKDIKSLWREYENSSTRREIIIKLESFVRALSRQFTIGKLGVEALRFSSVLFPFIKLRDQQLGSRNYRKGTTSTS